MTGPLAAHRTADRAVPRRHVLAGAALGAAAAVAPIRFFDAEAAAAPSRDGVFGYGVASGDPTAHAVVIWTRATPPRRGREEPATPGSGCGHPLPVQWEVARDERFSDVVARGSVRTSAESDHTVKVDVEHLEPYTAYWYRFRAAGETSAVGRTRTAPDVPGTVHALRLALVSCSNYTGGFFTAYRAIARRTDLDFVLHVGDYIYEYGNGADRYGPAGLRGVRDSVPPTETVTLADYRLRHALHKADPDSQAAHAAHPWITIFDDHEVTNSAWSDGAENHDPGEGDWQRRRSDAYRAYLEWMPFRLPEQHRVPHQGTRFFRRFAFGPLGDLSVIETRQNRSRQVGPEDFLPLGDPAIEAALSDPARRMVEPEQLQWLADGVAGPGWHLVGNQVIASPVLFPGAALAQPQFPVLVKPDQWDGYRADQQRLLTALGASRGDAVVLTGDIHSSWAIDTGNGAATEFVCPSVTSDGFYEAVAAARAGAPVPELLASTQQVTGAVQATTPSVRYLDGIGHGFTLVDVTPERVQADFHLTPSPDPARPDPRLDPSAEPVLAASWQTLAGTRRVVPAAGPIGARSDEPSGL